MARKIILGFIAVIITAALITYPAFAEISSINVYPVYGQFQSKINFDGSNLTCYNNCINTQPTSGNFGHILAFYMSMPNGVEINNKTIIKIDVPFSNLLENNGMDIYTGSLKAYSNSPYTPLSIDLIDVSVESLGQSSAIMHLTYWYYSPTPTTTNSDSIGVISDFILYQREYIQQGLISIYRIADTTVNVTQNTQGIIDAINSSPDYTQNLNDLKNEITDTNNKLDDVNNNLNDIKDDINNEKDNISNQDTSDISDTTNENADNLLSILSQFLAALTSSAATNCYINADFGSWGSMGNLDLCTIPVPTVIQGLSSIILAVFVVTVSISVINKILNLIREMQS